METIDRTVRAAARRLAASGVEDALRDARLLMRAVRGWDAATLFARQQEALAPADAAAFAGLVARRRAREPVSRILGRREFWSLDFALDPATLDPRPDSETLVEAALAHAPDPRRLLDLGTGSGCLLLATLSERPRAFGIGLDRSEGALRTARANAISLGFGGRSAFVLGDWTDTLGPGFDLVLANPPYIPAGEIAGLEPEVRGFDPTTALDGGPDGLDAYRRIFADLGRILARDGIALFEHGQGQEAAVAAIARAAGFDIIATPRDFSGVVRVCAVKRGLEAAAIADRVRRVTSFQDRPAGMARAPFGEGWRAQGAPDIRSRRDRSIAPADGPPYEAGNMRSGPNTRRARGRNNNPGGGGGGGGQRRPGGNLPNRNQTIDSNGPDVRIRGTVFQVYEKYMALTRDAQSVGDRVMAENYQQHAEHYIRIINQINEAYTQQTQQEPPAWGGDNPDPLAGDQPDWEQPRQQQQQRDQRGENRQGEYRQHEGRQGGEYRQGEYRQGEHREREDGGYNGANGSRGPEPRDAYYEGSREGGQQREGGPRDGGSRDGGQRDGQPREGGFREGGRRDERRERFQQQRQSRENQPRDQQQPRDPQFAREAPAGEGQPPRDFQRGDRRPPRDGEQPQRWRDRNRDAAEARQPPADVVEDSFGADPREGDPRDNDLGLPASLLGPTPRRAPVEEPAPELPLTPRPAAEAAPKPVASPSPAPAAEPAPVAAQPEPATAEAPAAEAAPAEVAAPVKRPRGRPRKVKPAEASETPAGEA